MGQLREQFFAQFPLSFPEITSEDAEKAGGVLDAPRRIVKFDALEKAKAFCESFGLHPSDMLEEESAPGRLCVNDKYVDDRGVIAGVIWNLNWADDRFFS